MLMMIPVLATLVGIAAVYKGGGGTSGVHRMAAIAGAIVLLCISALPYVTLAAVSSFGGAEKGYEPILLGYSILAVISIVAALTCSIRLAWPHTLRRAAP